MIVLFRIELFVHECRKLFIKLKEHRLKMFWLHPSNKRLIECSIIAWNFRLFSVPVLEMTVWGVYHSLIIRFVRLYKIRKCERISIEISCIIEASHRTNRIYLCELLDDCGYLSLWVHHASIACSAIFPPDSMLLSFVYLFVIFSPSALSLCIF